MLFRIIQISILGILILISCRDSQKNTSATSSPQRIDKNELNSFDLDVMQSSIYWQGSSPTGKHNGSLKFQSGRLFSANNILKAGELMMDMHTISNLDLEDASDRSDIENHLKSVDFFATDSFPVSQFKMSSITMLQDTTFNAIIHGFLTIKNVTKPLQVKCKVDHKGNEIMVTVPDFTIDRTNFRIMYQSKKLIGALKDELINDEIVLSINLVAKRQK